MQVNLLPVSSPDLANACPGVMYFGQGTAAAVHSPSETDELRERAGRDREREEAAVAALVPTRTADVISDAERNVDRSSRTFRRQVARDRATEQFREGRDAFREALTDAKDRRPAAASRGQTGATPRLGRGSEAESASGSQTHDKRSSEGRSDSGKASATPAAARVSDGSATNAASARVSAPSSVGCPPGGVNPPPPSAAASAPVGVRVVQAVAGVSRGTAIGQTAVVRPAGTAKAGAAAHASAHSSRAPGRSATVTAARPEGAERAEDAARRANIERIVRVVRTRMRGDQSHTVMRLDPPELGRVRLQMDLRGAALTLLVDTSTELAHRLLSEDVEKLRHGLEASGIQLARVEVRPPTLAPEAGEQNTSQQADTQEETQSGSAQTDAEHPEEHGKDSPPAAPVEAATCEPNPVPATESLVNVVA